MDLCRRHDCAHEGDCPACEMEEQLAEAGRDLQSTRAELIRKEHECENLQDHVTHLQVKVESLEERE